jgi:sialate O-acetylesterase
MRKLTFYLVLSLLSAFFVMDVGFAEVRLPKLVSNGMVLQRDAVVNIWGWASPGEKITVNLINDSLQTVANEKGEWSVAFKNLRVGGPYSMEVKANNIINIQDILVGDVWLCSGQSNMELPMRRVAPFYPNEIANCENANIRQFAVPQVYNFNQAQADLQGGEWKSANAQNISNFSAVAYFFAKELYDTYKVPVGLINASLGGAPAEAYISEEALKKFPVHFAEAQKFKDSLLIKKIDSDDNIRFQAWYDLLNQRDKGLKENWKNPLTDVSGWESMKVPGYWASTKLGAVNGAVWFRKEFQVAANWTGKEVRLNLGRIVDADSVFINGIFVGTTSYQYPPRWYNVPANVLKVGKNTIVVRLISNSGQGGFVLDKPYEQTCDGQTIDLKGDWQYKLGATMDALGSQTFIRWKPVGLYNGMISPLLNYRIKGVVWYQGESNASRPQEYRELFPALINDWRAHWNQGDFPFLFVQLANFMDPKQEPGESDWALLREAQLKTLSVPNTAMAVISDIGEWNDIHPVNKKDVGFRLALAAKKLAYGDDKVVFSGPTFESMKIEGEKIILSFKSIGGGLNVKGGGELKYFAIAGADKKFVWAKAQIVGNTVVVWCDAVKSPVAVRYAWADDPEGANLYNKEGLPASSFRTDEW